MCWLRSAIYRMGITCLVCLFMLFSTVNFNQGWAAPSATWKPNKPMTIILSSLGGAYDWMARQIARVLPDYLGQKVIVQGVLGAEGRNALDTIQRSKPDGQTFGLLGVGTYVACELRNPYAWHTGDIPVLLAIETPPYGVFSSPKSPYAHYEDLVKTKNIIRIASATASFAIVPILIDFEKKGIQYKVARFKGSAESNLAVVAGNADLTPTVLSGVGTDRLRAGDFRALWVFDAKRFPMIPNVPTHAELGMPKEWSNYRVARLIQVAPGTPEHIQKALKTALLQALKDKRTLEWSKKVETPVEPLSDADCMERIRYLVNAIKEHKQIVDNYY